MIKTVETKSGIIRQGTENEAEIFIVHQYTSLVQTPHENFMINQNI